MHASHEWSVLLRLVSSRYSSPSLQSSLVFQGGFSHAVACTFGILPPVQLKQVVEPRISVYSPGGHFIQEESLPYFPKSQSMQTVLSRFAKDPAVQSVQNPPEMLILPSSHLRHIRLPRSPDISSPASHTAHAVLPFSPFVNVPPLHSVHDVPPRDDV